MKKPKLPRLPRPYPSDVSDDEWSFIVPYLTLIRLDIKQREHDLRAVFLAATPLGGGTQLCLGCAIPPSGTRL
jgi:hypothetical protein